MLVTIPINEDLPIRTIVCHDTRVMFKLVSPAEFGVEIAESNGYACIAMVLNDRAICYSPKNINPTIEYCKTKS